MMRGALRRALATSALVIAAGSLPRVAVADDDPDRRAFSAGLACFDEKRYPCAIDAWEGLVERVGTARAWKVLYNLGIAHDEMGDATRALDRWEAFLAAAPDGEATAQRADAEQRIAALRARFAEIVVPPRAGVAATARIGAGRERAAGFRVLVAPGQHRVVLGTPGEAPREVLVDVKAGERREVTWPAAPAVPPAAPPRDVSARREAPEGGSVLPTALAITFGAATAASFALPIALGVSAGSTRDDAAAATTREAYDAAARDYEDEKTVYGVSYVLPAVLGAATIGFVVWALAEDDRAALARRPRSLAVRF